MTVVLLYLVSLALPAVYRSGFGAPTSGLSGSWMYGYAMLSGLPFVLLVPSWWANPVWLLGVLSLYKQRLTWAWYCGLLGSFLALLVLWTGPFPPDQFKLTDFHIGYYVWLSSMFALLAVTHFEIMIAMGEEDPG